MNKFRLSLLSSLSAIFVVIAAISWSYIHHVILAYGDAEAHINIAKRVFDSLTPGFAQLGGVWVPLPHILMIPFVSNDFLWRSGLAGSIVSGIAFIWLSYILYKFACLITQNNYASLIAPLVLLTNFNALYLATTPMSEILLLSSVTSAMYFFIRWIKNQNLLSLVIAGFFTFLSTLIRYDGWMLAVVFAITVAVVTYLRTHSFDKVQGKVILFSFISFLGIALWLFWNKLIFNDFLYFANSQYGSKAQQMWFYVRGYLPTFKNLPLSALYYATDFTLILGILVTVLMVIGVFIYLINFLRAKDKIYSISLLLLLFPFFFYTISLFTGQASLILPQFAKSWYQWNISNVRYGIQMLLPATIFTAYLASRMKKFGFLIAIIVVLQGIYFFKTGDVLAYIDGTNGLSSQKVSKGPDAIPVEKWVSQHYDFGYVLMDDYRRPISPINSNIPMNKFIGVGNKPYWEESLKDPKKWDRWIILQKADTDVVWKGINKNALNRYYSVAFRAGNISVYKVRPIKKDFVEQYGTSLLINDKKVIFRGVNIYDLLAQSDSDRLRLLDYASQQHINLIRFWGFNKKASLTQNDFQNFDLALVEASKRNLKLSVVFVDQWSDWGGIDNYNSSNSKLFYSDHASKQSFKNFFSSIITHTNQLNSKEYKDDPTILNWELVNEPRIEGDLSGKTMVQWTTEMSQYIASLDQNHLISIGTEGFMKGKSGTPYFENHGVYLKDICEIPTIDICTAHFFPKYISGDLNYSSIDSVVADWVSIANQSNKPLFIGEIGYDLTIGNTSKRQQFYNDIKKSMDTRQVAGAVLWGMTIDPNKSYNISITDSNDQEILDSWSN